MVESSLNKKRFTLALFLVLLTMNNLYAKDHILDWKVLSNKMFNCSDICSINLFIDNENNVFVQVGVMGENRYGNDFLYINNNWTVIDKYGILLNGFIKDGYFYLAFQKDKDVVIYNIQEDIKFVSRIKSRIKIGGIPRNIGSYQDRVIPLSDQNGSYLFLGRYVKLPANPIEFLRTITSGGHGIYYDKPFLAEIQDDKMLKSRKIHYGGKIDESFVIKEVATGKDSIHFLGFRGAETPETSGPSGFAWNTPVILHYVDYNFKKKKTTRKHSICKKTPNAKSYYGPLSMDNFEDYVFVVFSWVERRRNSNLKETKLDIYYSQLSNNTFGDVEKIGNGFSPLLRVDSIGNVHILWVNSDGDLIHKVKKNNRWSEERIILNNLDIYPNITKRYISAEFDRDNNLNVIFPSNGTLVYAKVELGAPFRSELLVGLALRSGNKEAFQDAMHMGQDYILAMAEEVLLVQSDTLGPMMRDMRLIIPMLNIVPAKEN
jgi:hypothetical protein